MRVLLNPDSATKVWSGGLGFCMSNEVPGDAADAGAWATLVVRRLDDPEASPRRLQRVQDGDTATRTSILWLFRPLGSA